MPRFATVPICDECWARIHLFQPVRVREAQEEICHHCQQPTQSGIYIREQVVDAESE